MAACFLQVRRRLLLLMLTVAMLSVSCISSQPYPSGQVLPQPTVAPAVRPPKVGQEWVYEIRNVFNQELVDVVTERVISVGQEVRIQRNGANAGPLADEIQEPWGFIIQDPHWSPPQKFQNALPLWPEQLKVGWSGFYRTRYEVLGYPDSSYYWGLNISAIEWERVKVPAGEFTALKYHNEAPYFQSPDIFRLASMREEDVWLAPEIGRWVIRRGFGRYLLAGTLWQNAYWEDYLEWRLVSWK